MPKDDVVAEILAHEERRSDVIVRRDLEGLAAILSDDLVHIHSTGKIDTKASYIAQMREARDFRAMRRSNLVVRTYGDIAVATGDVTVESRPRGATTDWVPEKGKATVVWKRHGPGSWRVVSFHANRIPSAS